MDSCSSKPPTAASAARRARMAAPHTQSTRAMRSPPDWDPAVTLQRHRRQRHPTRRGEVEGGRLLRAVRIQDLRPAGTHLAVLVMKPPHAVEHALGAGSCPHSGSARSGPAPLRIASLWLAPKPWRRPAPPPRRPGTPRAPRPRCRRSRRCRSRSSAGTCSPRRPATTPGSPAGARRLLVLTREIVMSGVAAHRVRPAAASRRRGVDRVGRPAASRPSRAAPACRRRTRPGA